MYIYYTQKNKRKTMLRCDVCKQALSWNRYMSAHKATKEARENGWTISCGSGMHRCPQCKNYHLEHRGKVRIPTTETIVALSERSDNNGKG